MPVNNENILYSEYKTQWAEIRDCVKGNAAIKAKGTVYLPKLSGMSDKEYERYSQKVKFFGATGRTLEGLHGNIFRRAPIYSNEVSETFTESLNDVDLIGTSLEQFASDIVFDCLQTNWGGVLVDYAKVESADTVSKAEAEAEGLKAYLRYYSAETIINWNYSTIKGRRQLSLVVLVETNKEPNPLDRFVLEDKTIYRVLYLDGDTNTYKQDIYNSEMALIEGAIEPKMNGQSLTFIPFFPMPANNPEKSILYDLVQLNLQHYQDSADYQNGKHYTAIPTPIAIGLQPEYDEQGKPKPMYIGGTKFQFFPNEAGITGVDVKFLEFTGEGMRALSEGISHLEERMSILGAHIIAGEKRGVESVEALRVHRIGENSVLATFAQNISEELTKAVRFMGEWNGESAERLNEWSILLNTDYDLYEENERTLNTILTGRSNGEVPRVSVFIALKALNLIPELWDYEMFLDELDKDMSEKLPPLIPDNTEGKDKEDIDDKEDTDDITDDSDNE
jgi:hypothetical protein